jgi:hypothetical protein
MAGPRIIWIRSWQINGPRPMALAMRANSTGHFAGERIEVASSDCLCAGTNRMCPADIRMRDNVLWWPRVAAEFHSVSSRTGRIKIIKQGISLDFKEASAWRTALSMSAGSYSGLAIQGLVHM